MPTAAFSPAAFTSADGTRLVVDSTGTGPGLVVVPGAVAPPERYRAIATALSSRFAVHILHRRGHGSSGPQGAAYSMDSEVDDVLAAMAATGSTEVFGHSFGGLVALQMALRQSRLPVADQRLSRLMVYEPAIAAEGELPTQFLVQFEAALGRRQEATALTHLLRGLQVGGSVDRLPWPIARGLAWAILRAPGGSAMRHNLYAVPDEIRAGRDTSVPLEAYGQITIPTLVMVGGRSARWLRDGGQALSALSGGELKMLPELNHDGPLAKPHAIAQEILEFAPGASNRGLPRSPGRAALADH